MFFNFSNQKHIIKYNEQGRALIYISYDPATLIWSFSDSCFESLYDSAFRKFEDDVETIRSVSSSKIDLEKRFRERAMQLLDYIFQLERNWPIFGLKSYFLKPNGNVDFEFIETVNDLGEFDIETDEPVDLGFEENRRALSTLLRLAQNKEFCSTEKIQLIEHDRDSFSEKLKDPFLIQKLIHTTDSSSNYYEILEPLLSILLIAFDTDGTPLFAVMKEDAGEN